MPQIGNPGRIGFFEQTPEPPVRSSARGSATDPIPDPEPASPSLPEPDPGVYHPDPKRSDPPGSEAEHAGA